MPVGTTLITLARAAYRLDPNGIHGPAHWLRVLRNGREIVARTPGADLAVVEHFALLHDCRRDDDGDDPFHGARAAEYIASLGERLPLTTRQRSLLMMACEGHARGGVSNDPTVGACWDADRLELSRSFCRPLPQLLSTAAARCPELQAGAWLRGTNQTKESLA
jgi:uncharacterized protein